MNGKSLQQIIQFFYTSKIDITPRNVQDLLSTASLLQAQNVLDACCEFMRRQLTDENCLGKVLFAPFFASIDGKLHVEKINGRE